MLLIKEFSIRFTPAHPQVEFKFSWLAPLTMVFLMYTAFPEKYAMFFSNTFFLRTTCGY
jgi:hypothetical protein